MVRKKPLDESATRVGTFEKLLVAGAFVLIMVAVGVIVKLGMDGAPKGGPKEEDLGGEVAAQAEAPEEAAPAGEAAPEASAEEPEGGADASVAAEEPAEEAAPAPEATPAPEPEPTPEPREAPEPTPEPVATAVAAPAPAPEPEPEEEPVEAVQEAGPGTLTVNTYPWAKVFVDGADLGRTPLVGHSLPAGTHQLELIVPGAGDKKIAETITITAGEETKVVKRVPVEEEGEGAE